MQWGGGGGWGIKAWKELFIVLQAVHGHSHTQTPKQRRPDRNDKGGFHKRKSAEIKMKRLTYNSSIMCNELGEYIAYQKVLSLWLKDSNQIILPWENITSKRHCDCGLAGISLWSICKYFPLHGSPHHCFSGSSAGKESNCHAGYTGSIPGSGQSTGEGRGYPHQYSWASLVAYLVKNPPAMWETWVWSLGLEDPWRWEQLPTPAGLENFMDCIVHGL